MQSYSQRYYVVKGEVGSDGAPGMKGAPGETGAKGEPGIAVDGTKGEKGTYSYNTTLITNICLV